MGDSETLKLIIQAQNNASQQLKDIQKDIKDLGDNVEDSARSSSTLTGAIAGITASVTNLGIQLIQSGINKIGQFFQDASEAASDYEKSMKTLEIVSGRFDTVQASTEEVTKAARELGQELRIGTGPAADSLQNLFKSGLSLDQATDLMRRFANEAMTGKSNSISLAQAVQNLSFAYTTGNSALGNLSGVSENFSDIQQRGLDLLKQEDQHYKDLLEQYEYASKWKLANREDLKKELDAYEETLAGQAKYKGMIELTNLTLGSSAAFTGTLVDKQALLDLKMQDLRVEVGEFLNPILADFIGWLGGVVDQIEPYVIPALQEAKNIVDKLGEAFNALSPVFDQGSKLITDIVTGLKKTIKDMLGQQTIDDIKSAWAYLPQYFEAGIAIPIATKIAELRQTIAYLNNDIAKAQEIGGEIDALNNKQDIKMRQIGASNDPRSFLMSDSLTMSNHTYSDIQNLSDEEALLWARSRGFTPLAAGGDFITTGPRMLLVGDNPGGRERVQVTPLSSTNINGPKKDLTINQVNVYNNQDFDMFLNKLKYKLR